MSPLARWTARTLKAQMPTSRLLPHSDPPGLAARRLAAEILENILYRGRTLDDQLEGPAAHPGLKTMAERDRALMRNLISTVLRRLGTLRYILGQLVERSLPPDAPRTESALLIGAAQIIWLNVPDHAAVDLSVRLVQANRQAARHAGLVNAVLRRCAREGKMLADEATARMSNFPGWLVQRWTAAYGEAVTQQIVDAISVEPPLDLTVKSDAPAWAARMHGEILPTGSLRTLLHGPIAMLPGFSDGAWWVQDAAAALPARLFGDIAGKSIVDLCAAPGGKTAQLAFAGAKVTALDRSAARMTRLKQNLARLRLEAECVVTDANDWAGGPFDGVLLDAPCSATGTIRRHPDIAWVKHESDIAALAALQQRLLAHAVTLLKPGGTLVYCVCSLEPEEGEQQIAAFLAATPAMQRVPVEPGEIGGLAEAITPEGDIRTLPCFLPHENPRMAGLDGFFAARLRKS